MDRLTRLIGLVIAAAVAAVFLLLGFLMATHSWDKGGREFSPDWLLIPVVLSRTCVARLSGASFTSKQYLAAAAPFVPMLALGAIARYLQSRFVMYPSSAALLAVGLAWSAFLVLIIYWIMTFSYENIFGPHDKGQLASWRRLILFSGIALMIVTPIICLTSLMVRSDAPMGSLARLPYFESKLFKLSLLVYSFLVLRMLFPIWESDVTNVFGSRDRDLEG